MMDRSRSPMRMLGVTASLMYALSLAGLGMSHAGPSDASQSVHINEQPCNAACEAYMAWSDRATATFRPSPPLEKSAAHDRRPPRTMVHHAAKTRQPGLNSFAQLPAQSDATPESAETSQAAETPQAEVAPPRPIDEIADRFPAAAEFMPTKRVGTDIATNNAAERTVVAAAGTTPARATGTVGAAAHGPHMRLALSLLLALGALPALAFWWWFRARRHADREHDRLLTFDRAIASARREPKPIEMATE